MSYQELPRMTEAERRAKQKQLDDECRGRIEEWARLKALELTEREIQRLLVAGRIERGEVINGD